MEWAKLSLVNVKLVRSSFCYASISVLILVIHTDKHGGIAKSAEYRDPRSLFVLEQNAPDSSHWPQPASVGRLHLLTGLII